MWPNTVGAQASARAPRQRQDLATIMDAVSFLSLLLPKLCRMGPVPIPFFWPMTALKTLWPQLLRYH